MTAFFKIALHLAQPLCLIWLLLSFWLGRSLWRRRRGGLWLPALAWGLLTLISCTPLASLILADLEETFPAVKLAELATADAIVCLGGGTEPSDLEPTGFHLKTGADRLSTALTLASMQQTSSLVLGGGGYEQAGEMISEADALQAYCQKHLTLKSQILSLGVCSDTHDEALKVAALAKERGWKTVLLVTSAYHMPRSMVTFRKAGVPVSAVPCNYLSSLNRVGDLHWIHLPSSQGFELFSVWVHEFIGHWVYYWRGWL